MNSATATETPAPRPSYYELLGSAAGIRQLVTDFYNEMEQAADLQALRAMHAADLGPMRQTLAEFLSGWLGGPRTYWERTNAKCMMSAHAPMPISRIEATQWVTCMQRALRKLPIEDSTRLALDTVFTKICTAMVNRQ